MPNKRIVQYQETVVPTFFGQTTPFESRFHQPWSEPRRYKNINTALIATSGIITTIVPSFQEVIFEDKWHFAWSEPIVKVKRGLGVGDQQTIAFAPLPIINITWFNWMSEPVRKKRGQLVTTQPFFNAQPTPIINISWFGNLSEPVRFKLGLKNALQQSLALNFPIPFQYSGIFQPTETKDIFTGILSGFSPAVSAYVDIIEHFVHQLGYVGFSEEWHITANVSINEAMTVPTGGTPVIGAASAIVAIREL